MKRLNNIIKSLSKEHDLLASSEVVSDNMKAEGYAQALDLITRLQEDIKEKDKTDIYREASKEIRKVVRSFKKIADEISERRDYRENKDPRTDVDIAFSIAYETIEDEISSQITKTTNKYL